MSDERAKKKPRGKPFTKGDPRRGKGGRPRNRESISFWFGEFGNMTGAEAARACQLFASEFNKAGNGSPLFALIAARTILALINDPADANGRLLATMLDRTDGKVVTPIELTVYDSLAKKLGVTQDEARRIAERVRNKEITIEDVLSGKVKLNAD